MNEQKWASKITATVLGLAGVLALSSAGAATDPVEQFYSFNAVGDFDMSTGKPSYLISAEGRAPVVRENGIVRTTRHDDEDNGGYKVMLTGARISFDAFDPSQPAPIVRFSCEGCTLTYPDGSVLVSDTSVPLEGRALFIYGPVAPDPASSVMSIRMMGCSGLREVAGVGKLAGKVGAICFNGEFNFDMSNQSRITGQSNCTIVTHSPMQ